MSDSSAVPAATVALGRDLAAGMEVLMLRRTRDASFAAGAWVFPGGRVDPADAVGHPFDSLEAARRAAVRETAEEAGIDVGATDLYPVARWTPGMEVPKRFVTWMLFGRAPERTQVTVDGAEIIDYRWLRPGDALSAHARREFLLLPPTWMTLHFLNDYSCCAAAIEGINRTPVESYESRLGATDECRVVLWHGDAGYDTADATAPGERHRLVLARAGWRLEKST
ncbi:NUDIX hydrolase [Mycobacterium sp.]|uniref:NUDIX hydrolase n=1 Tax=Mycobacterium sp. TaxID=1785 RepID=UPI003F94C475